MSFYLRKSIKAGPFRVNLSRSGIGVSAGIPGLRVGTGPRGSYVRVGADGVYYQSTLNSRPRTTTNGFQPSGPRPGPAFNVYSPSDVVLSDVTGTTSLELQPAQPSDLVTQLNAAAQAYLIWPWSLALTIILGAAVTPWILIPGVLLTVWLAWRDNLRRAVVVFYQVEGPEQVRYQNLVDKFGSLMSCAKAWHVVAAGAVRTTYQYKVNAGATAIIRRESLTRSISAKPNMKTNIAVPTLRTAGRSVYLLPDRILVKDGKNYADIFYQSLRVNTHDERFIEDGIVPADATRVGTTWKYVNKGGGPDRRFKDNRQLPVMLYGRVDLSTPTGLNILWSFSNSPAARAFGAALTQMQVGHQQGGR